MEAVSFMKGKKYPLRTLFLRICLILWLAISSFAIFSTFVAVRTIRRQTYEIMNVSIAVQAQRIYDALEAVEFKLAEFSYANSDILALEALPKESSDWFAALYRLRRDFGAAFTAQMVDHYFIYNPTRSFFLSDSSGMSLAEQKAVQERIDDGSFAGHKWLLFQVEGTYHLVRIFRIHNSYLGAWISVDNAIGSVAEEHDVQVHFNIANSEGELLRSGDSTYQMNHFTISLANNGDIVMLGKDRFLLVTHPLPSADCSLVALVPDNMLGSTVGDYFKYVAPFAICVLAVLLILLHSAWVTMMRPMKDFTEAIVQLRSGNTGVRVHTSSPSIEFDEMSSAFNEMVSEIQELKIGVYEEQLLRQDIHIAYLKMQVTPHFLVNCLNTVYQLTEANQPQLTQRMVVGLSRHLRYMLSADIMVPLSEELDMVQNYVELTSIRYPGGLELITDYAPQAMEATVIPLLVLNFVENTVKYEAGMDRHLEVHVNTRIENREGKRRLVITIWDTGGGFSQDVLKKLEDVPAYIKEFQNRHIGISNVFQRAQLVMGDCRFHFTNRSGAGAQIDIDFPFIPYTERG